MVTVIALGTVGADTSASQLAALELELLAAVDGALEGNVTAASSHAHLELMPLPSDGEVPA
jgi:hypothetical protein